ncbi:MAG: hypothetical protein GY874_18715 [Desulfobacteraceae bacterium]|nr:hypothetical protein [Desulfobacteraceae bacterium]
MMIIITKYSTVEAADLDHLMPPWITIATYQSIEEVFGFNLSHWSTQLSEYSRHTSDDAIVVGGGGAKKEGREIWPSKATEMQAFSCSAKQAPWTPDNTIE